MSCFGGRGPLFRSGELRPSARGMVASFDCRSPYDPAAYAAAVLEEHLEETRVVYATVFFGAGVGDARDGYLACSSSSGKISVFNVDLLLAAGPENDVGPALVIAAHHGSVYTLVVHGGDGCASHAGALCSGGDDGRTAVWRIADIVAAADAKTNEKIETVRPAHVFVNPQQSFPRGALGAVPETNALGSDAARGVLFAAAGDGVCYGWDVGDGGRKAPTFSLKGHSDTLHCIATRVLANQVVTGSEDGTARIWDARTERASQVVNPWAATETSASGGHTSGSPLHNGDSGQARASKWVGCVALDAAENWCAMGCGGGTVTMWSFAANACASRVTAGTGTAVQAVRLTGERVVAAGNTPFLFRWNLAGKLISRQPCRPESVFAIDTSKVGAMTAVAGACAAVDIFSALGTKVATARCA